MFYTFEELRTTQDWAIDRVGGKAASLLQMIEWGLPVPTGGVILAEAFDAFRQLNQDPDIQSTIREGQFPEALKDALQAFLKLHPGTHFAVRSSGSREDLQDTSFAGLYTTILNVKGDAIYEAIRECWASLFYERVLTYCKDKGIASDSLKMAVVIQEMIPAEKSGVVFTVNPTTGRDTDIVVEACFGLGEALVGGLVTPDRYIYDWYLKQEKERTINQQEMALFSIPNPPFTEQQHLPPETGSQAVLDEAELAELAELAVKVQSHYGFPIDMEWVKDRTQFYIVQSRPITQLNFSGIDGEWTTADFKDGGVSSSVCSQFMWSLYDFIWEITMPTYLKKTHLIDQDQGIRWAKMFFGRPYWNVGAVKDGLKRLLGFVERSFDEDLGIQVTYEGDGYMTPTNLKTIWAGLQVLGALKVSFEEQMNTCHQFASQQREKLKKLDHLQPENFDRDSFFKYYESFIRQDYFLSESTYFYLIYDNSNATTLFKEGFTKLKTKANYLNLISGLTDMSHLRQNYALWDISQQIKAQPEVEAYWRDTAISQLVEDWHNGKTANAMDTVRDFIETFKYHSTRELDITVPRFGEDPSFVMENLKNNLELDEQQSPRVHNQRQHAAYQAERTQFLATLPMWSRKKWRKKLEQLRQFLWWREELRDLSTQYYYHVRHLTLILADHWVDMGVLVERDDVFQLTIDDICEVLHEQISIEDIRQRVQTNRDYYQSFRHFQNPNELGSRYRSGGPALILDGDVLTGVACSPGVVTGQVKVIRDIFDADRLVKGDILITPFTDPGWTPKFGLLAGVATETGGLLSHAAVIAREYGIPAVLAIPGLTQILKDGQTIILDGNQGKIAIQDEIS